MKNIKIIQELHDLGITGYHEVSYNPSYQELYEAEVSHKRKGFEKGALTDTGAVAVKTGIFTGRSPKDRYIVKDDISKDTICWDKPFVLLIAGLSDQLGNRSAVATKLCVLPF